MLVNNSMNLIYIRNLAEQYKMANGLSSIDLTSKAFLSELREWIIENQKMGVVYTELLNSMDLNFKNSSTAEVGKGEYDSVVKPFNTSIITEMPINLKGRVDNADFIVTDEGPRLSVTSKYGLKYLVDPVDINNFMIQNPYDTRQLDEWQNLRNFFGRNIIIGMYGRTSDRDKFPKIRELERIKHKLRIPASVVTEQKDGNYYSVLATNDRIKPKIKILTYL